MCYQGQVQVLWGLKLIQFLGPSVRKEIQSYEYKIRCESEYLFWALPKASAGAHASEGP